MLEHEGSKRPCAGPIRFEKCWETYVIALGFLPRVLVDPGAAISKANTRSSTSWKKTDIWWRSAFASLVSLPCLC